MAVIATGGRIPRRLYYTTNYLVEYPIISFVAVTSRTPPFRREDVVDRLLLFRVERRENFRSEAQILAEVGEKRDGVMSDLVHQLQRVLMALRDQRSKEYKTSFRARSPR